MTTTYILPHAILEGALHVPIFSISWDFYKNGREYLPGYGTCWRMNEETTPYGGHVETCGSRVKEQRSATRGPTRAKFPRPALAPTLSAWGQPHAASHHINTSHTQPHHVLCTWHFYLFIFQGSNVFCFVYYHLIFFIYFS